MSHTATVEVEVKDVAAFRKACERLKIPYELNTDVRMFDGKVVHGMAAYLPGWKYPAVFDGVKVHHDLYNEAWGKTSELDKFKVAYVAEAAKNKMSSKFTATQKVLPNGTVQVVFTQKG